MISKGVSGDDGEEFGDLGLWRGWGLKRVRLGREQNSKGKEIMLMTIPFGYNTPKPLDQLSNTSLQLFPLVENEEIMAQSFVQNHL